MAGRTRLVVSMASLKPYIVTVRRDRIRDNRKRGYRDPIFRVSLGRHGKPWYAKSLSFPSGCELVYNPEKPLKCGATVWIEAYEVVTEAQEDPEAERQGKGEEDLPGSSGVCP